MYPASVAADLQQRLFAAGLDHDAVNVIVKTGNRLDVPDSLGEQWADLWRGQPLDELARLSPADQQHFLARQVEDFLQDSVHRLLRARHAATQTADPDLRTAGELAVDLHDLLEGFGNEVTVPSTSPFTGKVKYATLTDLDVLTTKAILEVSTRPNAAGKVAQLAVLLGSVANPRGLPVFHYLPHVNPVSYSARALRTAGSSGVYNDRARLVAAVRALA